MKINRDATLEKLILGGWTRSGAPTPDESVERFAKLGHFVLLNDDGTEVPRVGDAGKAVRRSWGSLAAAVRGANRRGVNVLATPFGTFRRSA